MVLYDPWSVESMDTEESQIQGTDYNLYYINHLHFVQGSTVLALKTSTILTKNKVSANVKKLYPDLRLWWMIISYYIKLSKWV